MTPGAPPGARQESRSRRAPLLGVAVVAAVTAAWSYASKPLWRDEVYTLSTAGRPLRAMADLLAIDDAGLTGWYAPMHAWLSVGSSAAWVRLPTTAAAVAAAVLAAAVGRRAAGTAAAWGSGLLVAVLPVLVVHTQEARPYAVVAAGLAAVALLALRHLAAPSRGRALAWALVALVPALVHPLPALPSLAGIALGALVAPGAASRRSVVLAAVPAGVVGLVPIAVGRTQQGATQLSAFTLARLLSPWQDLGWAVWVAVVVLVLAAVGAVALRRHPSARAVLVCWVLVPTAALEANGAHGGYFRIRYFIGAAVAVTVLAGVGAAGLGALLRRLPLRRPLPAVAVAVVLAVLVGVQGAGALAFRTAPYYQDDPRGAGAYITARARPGDAIVYSGTTTRPLLARYLPDRYLRGPDQLDDVLLVSGPVASDTVGGRVLPRARQLAALAGEPTVWVVGTRRLHRWPLASRHALAALRATHERTARADFGLVRVERWDAAAG